FPSRSRDSCAARVITATSRSTKDGRSPVRRAVRCRGSRWRYGAESSTQPEWSCASYETSSDPRPEGDDLQRHQPDRHPHGGPATVAADGDHERLAGWGFVHRLAGGAFLPLPPGDLRPPYWINMGAMAISTLAGARLVDEAGRMRLLGELLPFLK